MWGDSIVSVLKPIWVLCRLFGICNSSIDEKIKVNKPSIFQLTFRYGYSTIILALVFYLCYATNDFGVTYNHRIVIQLADVLFTLTNSLSMMSAVIVCLIHQDKLTTLIAKFNSIDMMLKSFSKLTSYKKIKIIIVLELVFTISIWILFAFHYVIMKCPFATLRCLRNWVVVYSSTKISQIFLLQFCSLVVVAQQQIDTINRTIEKLCKHHNIKPLDECISEIEKIHSEILTTCSDIQTIFSIPLLMKVTNQFVSLFSSLYFCLFGYISNEKYIKPQTFEEMMIPLVTTIISLVEILSTVTICQLTVLGLRKTGKLLFRIPISRENSVLMNRINLYSLYLIHKKFEFTPCGFFKMNGSLLQTIAGAVTVYLVMFIQFNVATDKDSSSNSKL